MHAATLLQWPYSTVAAFPMLLYCVLASESVHLNVQLSVFSVTCASLVWELALCVAVLISFTAAFASAVVCLPHSLGTKWHELHTAARLLRSGFGFRVDVGNRLQILWRLTTRRSPSQMNHC